MDYVYLTQSGDPWSKRQLVWRSDMAVEPDKYGLYDMQCSQETNKAGELKFLITKGCRFYDSFRKERSVLTVLRDDVTLFRGVVKLIETDLYYQRTITANSDLIYFSDSVFEPHGKDIEETPIKRFERIINHHNKLMQGDPEKQIRPGKFIFASGADKVEKYAKDGGYKDTMSQLQDDLKDFRGFYVIRYEDNYSKKYLDFVEKTGQSTSQDIKFAVNLVDYQFDDPVDDLFTILIPMGGDNLNLKGQNEKRTIEINLPDQTTREIEIYVVDKYIKIVEGIQKYGYIYLAENFTVDSNNTGKSGSNGAGGEGGGDQYSYQIVGVLSNPLSATDNPATSGLYYKNNKGKYIRATETSPVAFRVYYQIVSASSQYSPGELKGKTFVKLSGIEKGDDLTPYRSERGTLYVRRAFTSDWYDPVSDTTALDHRTYYYAEDSDS